MFYLRSQWNHDIMQALPYESRNQCKRGKITFIDKKNEDVVKIKHGLKRDLIPLPS